MIRLITTGIVMLVLGFVGGTFFFAINHNDNSVSAQECPERFRFVNDLLDCNPKTVIRKGEYTELKYKLESTIKEGKESGKYTHVSVYFRDFVKGPTFGIASDEYFVPASLLKVPLMITYFSLAEKDPEILSKKTSYSAVNSEVSQSFFQEDVIKKGIQYETGNLVSRMIINSDNLAYGLLDKYLERLYPEEDVYLSTLKELGLVDPRNPAEGIFSVKTYASLFRQLYNASYLSPEMSDKALGLLAKAKFNDALVAGVPKGTLVAHKFGDREGLPDGEKQFHDCGIIYFPDNPYLLCIMTRGKDSEELTKIIRRISQMVYEEVESRKL